MSEMVAHLPQVEHYATVSYMRKGILKKEERSSRKATQEKLRIPQRELSLKCEFYLSLEMCFKNSYAVRLMSLIYHEPWVKHEPTSSQALICYYLLFLSFMATEKQF